MFWRLPTIQRPRDETLTADTPATPTAVVDATIPPSPPLEAIAMMGSLSISAVTSLTAPQLAGSIFGPLVPLPSQHLPEDAVAESAISLPSLPTPQSATLTVYSSTPSLSQLPQEEDHSVSGLDAGVTVTNTAYGPVSVSRARDGSGTTLKLRRNQVEIPPLEEEADDEHEEEQEREEEQVDAQPSQYEAAMQRQIEQYEHELQQLRDEYKKIEPHKKKLSRSVRRRTSGDETEDLPFTSVQRNGRTEHRANPYRRPHPGKLKSILKRPKKQEEDQEEDQEQATSESANVVSVQDTLDSIQHALLSDKNFSRLGVARHKRKDHKAAPYSRSRTVKPKGDTEDSMEPISLDCKGLQNDDVSCPVPPAPISEVPVVRDDYPRYRPPTPHPSALDLPEYDLDEQEWVPTRPNTPAPTNQPNGLGLHDVRTVIRTPTIEKITDVEDDDDRADNAAQADVQAVAHAVTPELLDQAGALIAQAIAEAQSAASTRPSPSRSTPGLYAESISEGPAESPLPKTPIAPPGGFDSEVAVRSPRSQLCEEIFGRSDDEDSDDVLPTPRVKCEESATTESVYAALSQRPPISTATLAPTLAESVIGTDIQTEPCLPPSATTIAVPPQREMSWTTLPVSSLPATAPPTQPVSAFVQSSFTWGQSTPYQAPPPSWSQSTFPASSSTSTWMAPPAPAPSSTWMAPPQSMPAFYQPITVPQFSTVVQHVVQHVAPSQAQAEVDMGMDVDAFADVAPPRPRRHRHPRHHHHRRVTHDYRRAAGQLLRVASVEPAVDLRQRVARRMFKHRFTIRQRPVTTHPFQDERAKRRGLTMQWRNRDPLRRAWRPVRHAFRPGRAARTSRGAPQPIQRTMSVDMIVECDVVGVVGEVEDIDMDGCAVAAVPAVDNPVEMMMAEAAFDCEPSAPLLPPAAPAMPVEFAIPAIVIIPGSPLPQQQQQPQAQENLLTACLRPSPPSSVSFVPEPAVPVASASATYEIECPPREDSSVAEFEVPLVEAAAPASTPDVEPAAEVEPIPAATGVPEAVVESQPSADQVDASDDETEWEPVPVPAVQVNASATPAAQPSTAEHSESTPDAKSVSAEKEKENPAQAQDPVAVPAPNIAEAGPAIVFHSYRPDQPEDDDNAVSLGRSEDEAERRAMYGADGECGEEDCEDDEDDEDYEDDGEDDEDEDYDDDEEEDDEEETEEETEEEGDDEEESNEYVENAPINGPVRRTPAPTSAPAPTPSSAPTAASISSPAVAAPPIKASTPSLTPLSTPSTLPSSSIPNTLTGGPYIGIVGEMCEASAGYPGNMQLLANAANVSSGASDGLSGEEALEKRMRMRHRNAANQMQQKKASQDLIRSITAGLGLATEATPSHGPFTTTTPSNPSGNVSTIPAEQHGLACPPRPPQAQDRSVTEEVHTRFEEGAELVFPRVDKGKGKAARWEDPLVIGAHDVDPSCATIIEGWDLSPEEVRLNMDAFPRADTKIEAAPSHQCACRRLSNGPSSGHTLACQHANGALPLALKTSTAPGFGSPVGASPTTALLSLGSCHELKPPMLEVSPQIEQSQSMTETDGSTNPVDHRKLQPTQSSNCLLATPLPASLEQSSPATELAKEDTYQQLTGVAKSWDDLFSSSTTTSTPEQSIPDAQAPWLPTSDYAAQPLHASTLPPPIIDPPALNLSAAVQDMSQAFISGSAFTQANETMNQEIFFLLPETAPATSIDFSAITSRLDADPVLNDQLRDLLSSIPDQEQIIDIDDFPTGASTLQDVASALPVSTDVDVFVPSIFSQVHEGDNVASKGDHHEEMPKIDVEINSYPLETLPNGAQQDQSSQPSFVNYPVVDVQPQPESDIVVPAAPSARPDTETEADLQGEHFLQPQPPFEQSLLLLTDWVSEGSVESVEVVIPLPPARVPTPSPCVLENESVHLVTEEGTDECAKELEHVDDPSPASETEAEGRSSTPDAPAPPSMPLVRRRSGDPRDSIALLHEKRTYFGPRPSSAQWNAFLQASPPIVHRPLFSPPRSVTNNLPLPPSPSAMMCLPDRSSGLSRLSPPSTSLDAPIIVEPVQPSLPSRGRPRRRHIVPTAMDEPKLRKHVAAQVAQADTFLSVIERRKRGERKGTKETHPSAPSSVRYPSCLPPSDCSHSALTPSLPSCVKPSCCPNLSQTSREPCTHAQRASGQLASTQWESESALEALDSDLEEEENTSWPQGWSASYLAKLSLAAGACFLLESLVF